MDPAARGRAGRGEGRIGHAEGRIGHAGRGHGGTPVALPLYHVDAFTAEPFAGNPAGVCLLDGPREERWMQRLAAELRHSETAFLRPRPGGGWDLRWFTPTVEVDLCGHATLASAWVLFASGRAGTGEIVTFHTASGPLRAWAADDAVELDFPAEAATETPPPSDLLPALGVGAVWVGRNRANWLVEVASAAEVRAARPDFGRLRAFGPVGVIVTARADEAGVDFVSRFFAPAAGIDEDPVTGSAHCALGPHWAERLGRPALVGRQLSERGGEVGVRLAEDERVVLRGRAVIVAEGTLLV